MSTPVCAPCEQDALHRSDCRTRRHGPGFELGSGKQIDEPQLVVDLDRLGDPDPAARIVGAAEIDAEDPARVIGRSPEPILTPDQDYEQSGFYRNTVFSCGHVPLDDSGERIRMYYGGADSCMAAADFEVKEIIASLASC